jgi:hypothetical protein
MGDEMLRVEWCDRDGGRLRRQVERHLSEMSPPVSIPLLTPTHILDRNLSYQDRYRTDT